MPPRAVARNEQPRGLSPEAGNVIVRPSYSRTAILKLAEIRMLGAEPVIHAQHHTAGGGRDGPAELVNYRKPATEKAAAVKIHHNGRGACRLNAVNSAAQLIAISAGKENGFCLNALDIASSAFAYAEHRPIRADKQLWVGGFAFPEKKLFEHEKLLCKAVAPRVKLPGYAALRDGLYRNGGTAQGFRPFLLIHPADKPRHFIIFHAAPSRSIVYYKCSILRELLQTCSYHPRHNKQHEHAGGHENGSCHRAEREAPRRGNGVGIAAGGVPCLT